MDSPSSDGLLSVSANFEEKDAEIRRLTKQLEDSRQEAHELRSRLQVAERCSHDYVAELEALHQDALEKDNQHAAAIREIQEERVNALRDAEEKIENWESEYQLMSAKVAGLEKELISKAVNQVEVTKQSEQVAALQHELEDAMDALTASTAACKQHKELVSVLQAEKKTLAQKVECLERDLELYKEHLSVSKAQLAAQTEEFKELQEQLAVTQSELSALKATPDVQSRGNSLFAEVEDNRQKMLKEYKMMVVKFNRMKTDYSAKCAEIDKMKKEKRMLMDKLEIAEREARKHYRGFVENYEIRIQELQRTVKDLKNDVKPVYINGNDEILKFAEVTVVNSRKEVESLRDEMELRSALRLNEAAELLKTRGELAQARIDLRNYARKVADLTAALNNQQGTSGPALLPDPTPEVTPEEEAPRSAAPAPPKKMTAVETKKPHKVVFGEELAPLKLNLNSRNRIEERRLLDASLVNMDSNESQSEKPRCVSHISMDLCRSPGPSPLEARPEEDKFNPKEGIESKASFEETVMSPVSMDLCMSPGPIPHEVQPEEARVNRQGGIENKASFENTVISRVSMDLCRSPGPSQHFQQVESEGARLNGKGGTEREASFEGTVISQVSMDLCKSEEPPTLTNKKSHGYLERNLDESSGAANLADELGFHFKLGEISDSEADEQSFTLKRNASTVVLLEGAEKESSDSAPCFSDELAALALSPASSDYFTPMEETNHLLPSNSSSVAENSKTSPDSSLCPPTASAPKSSSPLKSCDDSIWKSSSTPEKTEELLQVERSILKVRPEYSAFENSVEIVRKEVRFDKEEGEEGDKENCVQKAVVKLENKGNGEEKKPARKRPRPNKQSQPIIYMT